MARNGLKILDSDMHVFEPHDLYLKYMNTKWGDRVPRAEPRKRHGQVKFKFGDGRPLRVRGLTRSPPRRKQTLGLRALPAKLRSRSATKNLSVATTILYHSLKPWMTKD
jgi:hypothetical protein